MVIYMEFEWDSSKERRNIQKHGLSFSEAIETFFDPSGIQMYDSTHSTLEKRFYWIGKTKDQKVLTTWFMRRGNLIRIINLGNYMKQPKLDKMILDKKGTQKMRTLAAKSGKVKITINIDEQSLDLLKSIAHKTGASYQKLLNQILKDGLSGKVQSESRLDRLEKEIEKIRKKLAA